MKIIDYSPPRHREIFLLRSSAAQHRALWMLTTPFAVIGWITTWDILPQMDRTS
jgi:hypothetical protein